MYKIKLRGKFISLIKYTLNIITKLDGLSKSNKIVLLLGFEFILIIISFLLTNFFLEDKNYLEINNYLGFWLLLVMIIISTIFYLIKGEYVSISRYIKSSEIYKIAERNTILILLSYLIGLIFNFGNLSFKPYFLFWITVNFLNIIARFSLKEILIYSGYLKSKKIKKVAIYGAGAAGAQLASSLILDGSHKIEAFDDSPNLWGRKLLGIEGHPSTRLPRYKDKLDQILFAIPSLSKKKTKTILEKLKEYEIPVLKVPSINELTQGNLSINSLRPIEIEDLLGRVAMEPNYKLLKGSIEDLNICITGSGGSIGKEIFIQITQQSKINIINRF